MQESVHHTVSMLNLLNVHTVAIAHTLQVHVCVEDICCYGHSAHDTRK